MERTELLEILNVIFVRVLKTDTIILNDNTTANDIDGWDSLTNMMLIGEIEKSFNLRFTFREILKFRNIGDLCDAIQRKMN